MKHSIGTYECGNCNSYWNHDELIEDCCGDSSCGGDVFLVSVFSREDFQNTGKFYQKPSEE